MKHLVTIVFVIFILTYTINTVLNAAQIAIAHAVR